MTLRPYVLPLALLAAACGGGSNGSSVTPVETLLPQSGAVTGWTVDTTAQYSAANCATHRPISASVNCIDGSANPFISQGCTGFAGQQYVNGTKTIELWAFENASSSASKALYDYLPTCGINCSSLYDVTFEDVAGVGDGARIADTGTRWWINAWVGAYYFEFKLKDSTSPGGTIAAEKQEAIDFAKAVAAKLAGS